MCDLGATVRALTLPKPLRPNHSIWYKELPDVFLVIIKSIK